MKKTTTLFISLFCISQLFAQTSVCDTTGNIIIYSNYDGGVLNINVDQNIPNLKIGICTYEPVTINITGTYVANVTEVRYAGYVSTNNFHCSNSPSTTTITGVPANITSVNFLPAATLNNPNGYTSIVCNYSCSTTTNQGGCNTPDQIVSYFVLSMGGIFRSHLTQYGCWNVNDYFVSDGGNCCETPFPLGIQPDYFGASEIYYNSLDDRIHISGKLGFANPLDIELVNIYGETVWKENESINSSLNYEIPVSELSSGVYFVRLKAGNFSTCRKISVIH
ncbi:hypothetical protein BH09BAC5_BH09BAC5_15890 [soil metagenome]